MGIKRSGKCLQPFWSLKKDKACENSLFASICQFYKTRNKVGAGDMQKYTSGAGVAIVCLNEQSVDVVLFFFFARK